MITPDELKYYLKDNPANRTADEQLARDIFIKSSIEIAKSVLVNLCERSFDYKTYTEFIRKNLFSRELYLKVYPILEITELKYYSSDGYEDLISSPDTIGDSTEITDRYLLLRKNYSAKNKQLKITYKAGYKFVTLSGTVQIAAGTNEVGGTGTLFTTELAIGDRVILNGESLEVLTIDDVDVLTFTSNASQDYTGITAILNTYPEDLRQACLQIAAEHFLQSTLR